MPTQTGKTERPEPIEVDINDTSLIDGEALEYDLKEDFQARSAPPPGRSDVSKPKFYKFRLFIDDTKVEKQLKDGYSPTDPNGYFYKKNVVCKIQDEKWQDSIVYCNFSSAIPKGKRISSMVGMLQMLKVKVQPKMAELAVARLFLKALEKLDGPIQIAECDWGGWDSSDTKRSDMGAVALIAETGKAANTMLNFPKKADGSYQHIVHNRQGLEIVAKLKIIKWAAPMAPVNGQAKPVAAVVAPVVQAVEVGGLVMDDGGDVILDI